MDKSKQLFLNANISLESEERIEIVIPEAPVKKEEEVVEAQVKAKRSKSTSETVESDESRENSN